MSEEPSLTFFEAGFLLAFLSLFTLYLFLGEGGYLLWATLGLVLLYLTSLLISSIHGKTFYSRKDAAVAVAGGAFLLTLLAHSYLISISTPMSVHRWVSLAMGGLTFLFFLSTNHTSKSFARLLILSLCLPLIILVPWNIGFLFAPRIAALLPTSTLLTAAFGHNHAYLYYLFTFLLCAFQLLHVKQRQLWAAATALSVFGIVLSFSRIGIFLLLLSFGAVLFLHQKRMARRLKVFFAAGAATTSLVFFSQFTLALLPQYTYGSYCMFPRMQTQLCKSFSSDERMSYWNQALEAWLERPLMGFGGGTFSITSNTKKTTQAEFSSLAHNEYVQVLYEYGLLGGVILVSALFCAYWVWQRRSALSPIEHASVVFFIIAGIDALFNFNWSHSVYLLLIGAVAGLIIRTTRYQTKKSTPRNVQKISTFAYFSGIAMITLPLLFFSTSYIAAEILYRKSPAQYVALFPYLEWYVAKAIDSGELSNELRTKLLQAYDKNIVVQTQVLSTLTDPHEQFLQEEKLLHLDPLNEGMRVTHLFTAMRVQDSQATLRELLWISTNEPEDDSLSILRRRENFQDSLINFANTIAHQEPETAKEITVLAYAFIPWKLNTIETIFFQTPEQFPDEIIDELLSQLWDPIPHLYTESLQKWLEKKATLSIQDADPNACRFILKSHQLSDHALETIRNFATVASDPSMESSFAYESPPYTYIYQEFFNKHCTDKRF